MPAVIYIEPQKNYKAIARFISKRRKSYIFIPSVAHERMLRAACDEIGVSLESRILGYQSIDSEIDEMLYGAGMDIAKSVSNITSRVSASVFGNNEFYIKKSVERAFVVALHDRLVGHIRPAFAFMQAIKNIRVTEVIIIERIQGNAAYLVPFLKQSKIRKTSVFRLGAVGFEELDVGALPKPKMATSIRRPPSFVFKDIMKHMLSGRDTIFFINSKDRQYRLAAFPIISEMSRRGFKPTVLSVYAMEDVYFDGFDDLRGIKFFQKDVPKRRNVDIIKPHKKNNVFLRTVLSRVEKAIAGSSDSKIAALSGYIDGYLRAQLIALLLYMRETYFQMRPVVEKARGVAVLPGRYLEANMLVGIAKELGVPTVEIQSGTISPTPRFVAPPSDNVLAIEPFSRDVYVEYMGLKSDQVTIIGSPKMDFDLRPHRALTKEEARREISQFGELRAKVVTLATQPAGVAKMEAIVRVAARGLAGRDDITLLIKQHPNENEHYIGVYETVLREEGVRSFIVSKAAGVPQAILAADVVATYYSTVGLEAYSLGRAVISVNPFAERPPYDLQALGIAREVANAEQFLQCVDLPPLDDREGLAFIRDGGAINRASEFLQNAFLGRSVLRPLKDLWTLLLMTVRQKLRPDLESAF
ncbi:MAG: hypothetical protein ACK4NU_00795 [Brevundimonas sp.]